MKILSCQPWSICNRHYKFAKVIKDLGHEVIGVVDTEGLKRARVSGNDLDAVFHDYIIVDTFNDFIKKTKDFKCCFSHNSPDTFSTWAIGTGKKTIHVAHDFETLRKTHGPATEHVHLVEGICMYGSKCIITVSDRVKQMVHRIYSNELEVLSIPNLPLEEWTNMGEHEKLSKHDGKIHIVYSGGFVLKPEGERYFLEVFSKICVDGDVIVHVHPAIKDERLKWELRGIDGVVYEDPVPSSDVIHNLTKYDFGIIPTNERCVYGQNYKNMEPNKLFEYLHAGLPIIVSDKIDSMKEYVETNKCGIVYQNPETIGDRIRIGIKYKKVDDLKVFEDYSPTIEKIITKYFV